MKNKIEKLRDDFVANPSIHNLNILITLSHKAMLSFLVARRMKVDDAEDVLQEFFANEFDKCASRYQKGQEGKQRYFLYFMQRIVLFRSLSFYHKQADREIVLDKETINKNSSSYNPEGIMIRDFMENEVRDFFEKLIRSLTNENYKNALLLRLCLPISIAAKDAANILGCSVGTYLTWVYRANKALEEKGKELKEKGLISFDMEDAKRCLDKRPLLVEKSIIEEIDDKTIKDVLLFYIFEKKSIKNIASGLLIEETEAKKILQKGISCLLGLLKKKVLLRGSGHFMIDKDSVLEFLDSLDRGLVGFSNRRTSLTTGDTELDTSLQLIHGVCRKKENLSPSVKESLLAVLERQGLDLLDLGKILKLDDKDINALMSDDDNLTDEIKSEVCSFISSYDTNFAVEMQKMGDEYFAYLNDKLLKRYYEEKEKRGN